MSVAASLAYLLIGQRHPVGLYVNGGVEGTILPVELPPGSSQEQLIRILEVLAGVEPVACAPVKTLVAGVAPRLPWGPSVLVVAGSLPEKLLTALQTLRRTGPSLVNDIIMPPIGLLLGGTDFSNMFINLSGAARTNLDAAMKAGAATINYGLSLNAVIDFLIVAFVVFLVVR